MKTLERWHSLAFAPGFATGASARTERHHTATRPGSRFQCLVSLLLAAGVFCGCATRQISEPEKQVRIAALTEDFCRLSPKVDPAEAHRAADAAVRYPLELAVEWHAVRPAWYNNLLINAGIHPRGLCYQWADDLTMKLMSLHLQTLELRRGVARLGTPREHSSVVVAAPGQNFTNGIALDAWHYAGKVHWAPVPQDDYPWKEVYLVPAYRNYLQAGADKLEKQSKM